MTLFFVGSRTLRTPDNFQGHLSIFQGSRTQRDFKTNSRTILEIQGRLATLPPLRTPLLQFNSGVISTDSSIFNDKLAHIIEAFADNLRNLRL